MHCWSTGNCELHAQKYVGKIACSLLEPCSVISMTRCRQDCRSKCQHWHLLSLTMCYMSVLLQAKGHKEDLLLSCRI